jgi:hypothetical protein
VLVVIEFLTDIGVLADSEEADELARRIVDEELARARAAIVDRLEAEGVEASLR